MLLWCSSEIVSMKMLSEQWKEEYYSVFTIISCIIFILVAMILNLSSCSPFSAFLKALSLGCLLR